MLSWLFKSRGQIANTVNDIPNKVIAIIPEGFILPQSANELLSIPRRKKLLAYIWQQTSISREQFNLLYQKPIERYAELVQQFPASESHHHAYPGGMLDHGLEIIAYALKLRQSYLLPIGFVPEEQATHAEKWSAATAYAALLHDIGKIAVDLYVEYDHGSLWHPWHGPLTKPYRFKYRSQREYKLHTASTGLLYHQILDEKILDWLSQTPDLWASLLYALSGQMEHAGVLGDIVTKADQASVAQELGGDPVKAMASPKHALQRKLLDGLRLLVKEELKINNAGPSDGWLTSDALWLVSKTSSDKLRAHLLSQGISGIPSKNSVIFDVMQEHGLLLPTPEGKAIWNATVTSHDSGWSNTFTFLKISPTLIWETGTRPKDFAGTVKINIQADPVINPVIQDEPLPQSKPQINEIMQDVPADQMNIPPPINSPSLSSNQTSCIDGLEAVLDLLGVKDPPLIIESQEIIHTEQPRPIINTQESAQRPKKTAKNKKVEPIQAQMKKEPEITHDEVPLATIPSVVVDLIEDSPKNIVAPIDDLHDETPSGEHFMAWLKSAILNQKLTINEPLALIHTVLDTIYIVTPGIFMRYTQEFPQTHALAKSENLPNWRWIQQKFEKLKVHQKQKDGLNIWTCTVTGPKCAKKVHGYLLSEPQTILPDILFNNPYLTLCKNQNTHSDS